MGICEDENCMKYTIITVVVVVAVGLIVGLTSAFLIVHPIKATADDATLTRFSLSTANAAAPALSYNVTVKLSLYNPNWYRGISYEALIADFSFNGTRFDETTVPAFYQKPKKTAALRLTVGGSEKGVKLGSSGIAEFQREKATEVFDVEVRLGGDMKYKGRKALRPLVVVCPLRLQLVDPAVASTAFQITKCTVLKS